jgi:ABC-type nickel/cobalt efflux system permease component RcnA
VLFVINVICVPTIKRHVFICVLHIGGSVYECDTTRGMVDVLECIVFSTSSRFFLSISLMQHAHTLANTHIRQHTHTLTHAHTHKHAHPHTHVHAHTRTRTHAHTPCTYTTIRTIDYPNTRTYHRIRLQHMVLL